MAKCRRVLPRRNLIRNLAGLAALLLVPALTLTNAAPALATDPYYHCGTSQHCYSVAFANNSYYGVESNFSDNALTLPSAEVDGGGHISNEIWLTTTNGSTQDPPGLWVEYGVARGCSKFVAAGQTCSGLNAA